VEQETEPGTGRGQLALVQAHHERFSGQGRSAWASRNAKWASVGVCGPASRVASRRCNSSRPPNVSLRQGAPVEGAMPWIGRKTNTSSRHSSASISAIRTPHRP